MYNLLHEIICLNCHQARIPTPNSPNRNSTFNLKGQLRSICMDPRSTENMKKNESKILVNRLK